MAKFQASKKRQYKPAPKYKTGAGFVPSAAIAEAYRKDIIAAVLEAVMPRAHSNYAEDALTTRSLASLRRAAYRSASRFAAGVNKHSRQTVWATLEKMGQKLSLGAVDVTDLTPQIRDNVELITNLSVDAQDKLVELYKEYGPDQSKIYPVLKEMVGSRADLIAVDQNAKLFTVLNTQRMEESGLEIFEWQHSSAGKTPRVCHQRRHGKSFLLKGGPEELYNLDGSDANNDDGCKEGDRGKPGYAIRCRCRMKPKVSLDD